MPKKNNPPVKIVLAIVVIIAVFGAGSLFLNQKPTVQETVSTEVSPQDIVATELNYYKDANGYFVRPSETGKYPGLILIHEWWGLNDNIKKLSHDFAEEGYVVLAVDLYGGESTSDPDVARRLASGVREDMPEAFENLNEAVRFLKVSGFVEDAKLASVGWCFGGGWSYQMAKNDLGVDASVIYYGQFNPEDDLSIMRANILGHFGEDDASILVDDVREFEAVLKTRSGDHHVFIYPNSGHAFANEDSSAYVKESADLAWTRTVGFLNKELRDTEGFSGGITQAVPAPGFEDVDEMVVVEDETEKELVGP